MWQLLEKELKEHGDRRREKEDAKMEEEEDKKVQGLGFVHDDPKD